MTVCLFQELCRKISLDNNTTSLLAWHGLGNFLGTSVGLVDLGVLCKSSSLQIATVKDAISSLDNNGFRPAKLKKNNKLTIISMPVHYDWDPFLNILLFLNVHMAFNVSPSRHPHYLKLLHALCSNLRQIRILHFKPARSKLDSSCYGTL
jgi:hypothetical protein